MEFDPEKSRRILNVKFWKRTAAMLLALLLCAAFASPVFATEAGGETEPPQSEGTGTENEEPQTGFDVTFYEVNQTVYAIAAVNVRIGPGTDYAVVGTLSFGHSVNRTGVGSNGWSRVIYNGEVAYISSNYLSAIRPGNYNVKIDDAALLRQIAIANDLNRADYTKASWDVMTAALMQANQALNGNDQQAADKAEKNLQEAIAALVKMNCAALENALAQVDALAKSDSTTALWAQLVTTAVEARELLSSGDQVAVDEVTTRLVTLLEQVQAEIDRLGTPNVVTQEVKVEVPPTSKFCNIPMHRVWPVLFAVSFALNAALIAVIVYYIYSKKKNQQDNTPLVDYDIFDDTL